MTTDHDPLASLDRELLHDNHPDRPRGLLVVVGESPLVGYLLRGLQRPDEQLLLPLPPDERLALRIPEPTWDPIVMGPREHELLDLQRIGAEVDRLAVSMGITPRLLGVPEDANRATAEAAMNSRKYSKVEVSVDGGASWADFTDYVDPPVAHDRGPVPVNFESFYPHTRPAPLRSGITGKPRWNGLVRR